MDGTDLTFKRLGEVATDVYDLYSFDEGEFLSFAKDDVTRYAVHIHFYKKDSTFEKDQVTINCHAIWSKSKSDGWWRQQLTLEAEREGKRWTAKLIKGEVLTKGDEKKANKFDPPPNTTLKDKLYEDVVDQLADILAYTLNRELNDFQ